jgi:type II secretory pathway pseudopilin PulG
VIALAAAVVGPSIGRTTDSLRTRAEVAGFSAFLRRAREHAVVTGRERTVTVDPAARLVTENTGDTVRAQRTFSEQLTIQPDPPEAVTVRFSPFGSSTGGAFRLSVANGGAYRVTIDALTGRVMNRREASP